MWALMGGLWTPDLMKCSRKGCSTGVKGHDVESTICIYCVILQYFGNSNFPGLQSLNMKSCRIFLRGWLELLRAAADISGSMDVERVSDRWAVGLPVGILICVEHKGFRQGVCCLCSLLWPRTSTATVLTTLSSVPALIFAFLHLQPLTLIGELFTQFPSARLVPPQRTWPNTPPSHTPVCSPRVKPIGPAREWPHLPSRLPTSPWIRVLPLGLQHGHGSLSLLRAACTASEATALRRQRLPCQGRSLNQCDDEVLGHSEGGPGVTRNLDLKRCRQKEKRKKKKPLHEEIQVTASCSCAFIMFSATTGRWSVIFLLV